MLNPTYVSSWHGTDAPISHSPFQHPKLCPQHPPQHPHGHVSEVGCCLRVLPICGCNSASGPSTLVQAKKSRAGCTFCRSFDVVVKSTTLHAHYTSPPAPTSPGSGRVEGKPARKPWVGAGTARSVDDVPCVTIQMLILLLSMNNYNLGALSTILM